MMHVVFLALQHLIPVVEGKQPAPLLGMGCHRQQMCGGTMLPWMCALLAHKLVHAELVFEPLVEDDLSRWLLTYPGPADVEPQSAYCHIHGGSRYCYHSHHPALGSALPCQGAST
jgi:hypothetical protein